MDYKVFTTAHDIVVHAKDMPLREPIDIAKLNAFEEERIQQRGGLTPIAIPEHLDEITTLLIDCSGSMRGGPAQNQALAVRAFGDAMNAAGKPFRILGHTTSAWKGGESRKDWIAEGRPRNPGRLNDLLHIVFHEDGENWAENRDTLFLNIVNNGILKENIDGEALAWVAERAPVGRIVYMTDGAPIDDATLAYNPSDLLDAHLNVVVDGLLGSGREVITLLQDHAFNSEISDLKIEMSRQKFMSRYVEGAPIIAVSSFTPDNILRAMSVAAFTPFQDLKSRGIDFSPDM